MGHRYEREFIIFRYREIIVKYVSVNHIRNNKNILIIPNVVDRNVFYYDLAISKYNELTFIAVAHWREPKNPFYFLNALVALKDENAIPGFRLIVIGDGPLLRSEERRVGK